MSNKLKNTPSDNTNIHSTLNTSVILPPMDYKIVDDMKKNMVKISLFELAKIQSQRYILLRALWQTTTDSVTSTSRGEITPRGPLYTVLNMLQVEEANSSFPPFLLSFEIFNYNVHNFLVDSSTASNVMPLSIAK